MVNLYDYDLEPINRNMRTFSEESFLNAYVNGCHESEPVCTATNRVRTIIYANYENADLYKIINEHYQHLTVTKQYKLLILLKKYEGLFDGSLDTWDTKPVDFELKEDTKPVCLGAYPVTKSQEMML